MASHLSLQPQPLLLSPINAPTKASNPLSTHQTKFNFLNPKPSSRHSIGVIRFSLKPPPSFPDLDGADGFVHALFSRTEGILYTLADAAVSASTSGDSGKDSGDWFTGITNLMETVLKVLKDGLSTLHVPYSYGFAIILLTVIVKAATFPLTKKQVESGMAVRSLQPQLKAIQQQYAGDKERIQLETARLYKLAGINPLAGCLPTVATIPVWIGLYRALSNVANEGLLTEGFFWIPSLAGPTTVAARQSGSGTSWLFPFVDGHPPLGWSDTLAYLVLPLLLIASQYISVQIMQSSQSNDPNMKTSQALTKVLPLMIGYFALSVPSGLSLYWFTNNILSTAQQIWLQKLGGAKNPVSKFSDDSIKEVQQQLQETVMKVNSAEVAESRKEESSSGSRPGDRFKQLKEQEARKKQQREEEKRKLAGKVTEMKNKEEKGELKSVKIEDEITEAVSADVQEERIQAISNNYDSSTGVTHVNGELPTRLTSEDHERSSAPKAENGGLAHNTDLDGRQDRLYGDDEKNDATERFTATAPAGGVDSTENTQPEGTAQQSKRDEL